MKQAIEEDTKNNYAEACKLYTNSLDYFMLALKCEPQNTNIVILGAHWLYSFHLYLLSHLQMRRTPSLRR